MKVKVIKIPIRHNGKSYKANDEFSINETDYEKVKSHVEVIEYQDDALEALRARALELGVPRASQLGEKKLLEGIAEKEAELQRLEEEKELQHLREKAVSLGIEDATNKDFDTLAAEIALKEGGSGDND